MTTKLNLAVQLYTLREGCERNFAAAVKDVARIGYRAVETAGYGNLKTAAQARKALDDAGLSVAGMHVPIEACEASIGRVLDDADAMGTNVVIVPWLDESKRQSAADWRRVGERLSRFADAANPRGIELAYHNHSFEFKKFEGRTAMEILFDSASPKVKAELDVYWLAHGGEDPVAFIERFGKRTIALHLKDMARGAERRFAPVGSGILDFAAITEAGQRVGVKYAAVEQDDCYGQSPLEAIRVSFENLKRLGIV
jgi:sugar phosphate isomerase/epimerase